MNLIVRWWKFNLVGAIGMILQLVALAVLNRLARGHYLWATATALELTLVHNFVWHLHYTWHDRCERSALLARFVKFHASNGAVSMAGNLALMWVLIREARMPLLASNAIAILCCSLVNFCLGNSWVFAVDELA